RVNAKSTVSAKIGRRRSARIERWSELERRDNRGEKQPRARLFVDQARIFCEPTEARRLRRHALRYRPGIHVVARFKWLGKLLPRGRQKFAYFLAEHIVIIVAPCVSGNPPVRRPILALIGRFRRITMVTVIVQRANNNASSAVYY